MLNNPEMNRKNILSLFEMINTLSLSSLNIENKPDVSLVPFLYYENHLWVFLSELSSHTQHLLANPDCSVLLYENEKTPNNLFAIERLSINCHAQLATAKDLYILDLMTSKLGETMSVLRQLNDFRLFSLSPKSGRYIQGFGQAYDIQFDDFSSEHVEPIKG